jgi:DNA-directed RNA polymerase specialized sigma24 family protein
VGQRNNADPGHVERLFRQLVVDRADRSDPLIRFVYLEDREDLLAAVLDRVRREKYSMIGEAVDAGITYRDIGERVGVSLARVQKLVRQAKEPIAATKAATAERAAYRRAAAKRATAEVTDDA